MTIFQFTGSPKKKEQSSAFMNQFKTDNIVLPLALGPLVRSVFLPDTDLSQTKVFDFGD